MAQHSTGGRPAGPDDHTLALVAAMLGLVFIIAAALVAILIAVPSSKNPGTVVLILLGLLANGVPILLGGIVNGRNSQKLDRVLNGEMDAKIKANVHQALNERTLATDLDVTPPAPPPAPQP